MATMNCPIEVKEYNGTNATNGWGEWRASYQYGSYVHLPDKKWYDSNGSGHYRFTVIRFKLPANFIKGTSVTLKIPFTRRYSSDTTGVLFLKRSLTDPTGGNCTEIDLDYNTSAEEIKISKQYPTEPLVTTISLSSVGAEYAGKYLYVVIACGLQLEVSPPQNWAPITGEYTRWTAGTAPKDFKVVDEGDNQYYFTGTSATAGENNDISKAEFYYTTDGSDPKSSSTRSQFTSENIDGFLTSGAQFNTKKNFNPGVKKRTTVKAYIKYTFEHGDPVSASCEKTIKFYAAPGTPGTPVISYTKSRLTIKEPWTFTWTAATPANDDSPIKGYRIRLYKNGIVGANNIEIKDSTGKVLSKQNPSATTHDLMYDRDGESTSITIDPVLHGFKVGDTVALRVYAYTKNGKGTQLFSANNAISAISKVQNAGVVHVKVAGQWKEGQVYVKVAGAWKEAETVNVKAGGAWKESQ